MADLWTLFLACAVIILYVWWKKTSRDSSLPPGPPTIPFLGNLLSVSPDTMLENFQTYRKKYGDVFSFLNLSVILSSGEFWKEQRTLSLNALREFGFGKRSMESKILEEVDVFVHEVQSTNGQPFNMQVLITVCVSNIMCSINFGERFEHNDKYFTSLIKTINENLNNGNMMFLASILPFLRYVPGDPLKIRKALKNVDVVEEYLLKIISDHKESFDENNVRDFIDVYLKKMKSEESNPNTTFDDAQLIKLLGDLFVAGTETTSTALRWFAVFMIRNPEVQEKMRKEINDVIGNTRYPTINDRPNLPYTEAVLHEVLRIGCIVPLSVPHGLKTDLKYKEFIIPKDVILIPNLYFVLFDPGVFEDPEVFRPQRFLDDEGKLINTDKVLTFSVGRRVCLGESLARMELFLFTSSMVQRFKILPADPKQIPPLKGVLGVTYGPKDVLLKATSV
ncbi:cytochrome P450 2C28-like [Saccostrea echinata]|uniref:cytochrome P450 2C28-like n=1 Tax=Saccostrea echinata TaxID=191078 RepID=UPI002A820406|nr:cytochrome P450 2C28-like [Saccostrea echinata]